MPELPLEESDLVIVGEVTNSQPFVSNSRVNLYTENTVQVIDAIKPKNLTTNVIAVVEVGGKARYNGRVNEWNVAGKGDPLEKSHQYLLFLGYRPEADAFFILKARTSRIGF